ncbi:MAG: hypothetical protein NC406_08425 [Bacteroides sp.]|nr:hypothetical protein [Bacteroides sp.]
MTREEIYKKLNRIEMLADDLRVCFKNNAQPNFMSDDCKLGEYAEDILAYVRANRDEQVMIDCCKINREIFYRYMDNSREGIGLAMLYIRRCLFKIHNLALSTIWGVSPVDVKNCTYYVNSIEGVCRHSTTGELLPIPTDKETKTTAPPTQGLPSELDTPEAMAIVEGLIKADLCKQVGAVYEWKATNALFGFMVWKVSEKLGITQDNDNIKWGVFQVAFNMTDQAIRTAKNSLSKVKNKTQNEPSGYDTIIQLCK